MKRALLLSVVFVLSVQSMTLADVISCWNFNDAPVGNAIEDLVGDNTGTLLNAVRVTDDTWEGAGALKINGTNDRFYASTTGFSVSQGTYVLSFKKDGTVGDWKDILGTNLKQSSDPIRIEHTGSGNLRLYVNSGTSLSATYNASSTLFDGDWHTVALTYTDGEKIKVYIDGGLAMESNDNYVASNYSMLSTFAVGNKNSYNGVNSGAIGRYDRVLVLDTAVPAAELSTYLDPSYVPEPTTIGLLVVGGVALLKRRNR